MKRTKLEEYVSLIQILQKRGPLEQAQILHLGDVDGQKLTEELNFLLMSKIVGTQELGGFQIYFATPIGAKITEYFGQPTVKLKV
jgi:hypothetical protein